MSDPADPDRSDDATDLRAATNQAPALVGHNVVTSDRALTEAVTRLGSAAVVDDLVALGAEAGSAEAREHGMLANRHHPELVPYDRFGNRVDEVAFHPSWHWLMERAVGHGLQAAPWEQQEAGDEHAHLRRAAGFFAWSQTEPGHGCPISMTYAAVPALRADDAIAKEWTPLLAARAYDPGVRAPSDKAGALAGMGMTEKQGGSDVRANRTQAVATADDGWYALRGHKWFTSAPMNDVFLVLAQAPGGLTCFVVPRVLPDGTRNRIDVVRLKDKLGNRSNASSELELDGTLAQRLGDEGRGVRTIIEMVAATRLDCVLGSASLMRHALAEAAWHVSHRSAFGGLLVDKPLMQNVVADLAVESEAATALAMRLASAVDRPDDAHEVALRRIALPWRSSGSASARPRWWPRPWSAWAATATSRSPACRCCSASRLSTPSGRARATSTRSTSCAPSAASPRCCTPGSPRSVPPAAVTAGWTGRSTTRWRCSATPPASRSVPEGWPGRWRRVSRAPCSCASRPPRSPTPSAAAGSGRRTAAPSAR